MRLLSLFIVYLLTVAADDSEDCDYEYTGDFCADHGQCCGGCCFYGECIDTYRSCYSSLDVCEDHVCVGEEECIVYIPPECPGCEPLPLCRIPELL